MAVGAPVRTRAVTTMNARRSAAGEFALRRAGATAAMPMSRVLQSSRDRGLCEICLRSSSVQQPSAKPKRERDQADRIEVAAGLWSLRMTRESDMGEARCRRLSTAIGCRSACSGRTSSSARPPSASASGSSCISSGRT